MQVGSPLRPADDTPIEEEDITSSIIFTVTHISTDNGILVSNLSFTAVMEINGQMMTCLGGSIREDVTLETGSGKDD